MAEENNDDLVMQEEKSSRLVLSETPKVLKSDPEFQELTRYYLTIKEACEYCGKSDVFVRNLVKKEGIETGLWKGSKLGKMVVRFINKEQFYNIIAPYIQTPEKQNNLNFRGHTPEQPLNPEQYSGSQALSLFSSYFRDNINAVANINNEILSIKKEVGERADKLIEKWEHNEDKKNKQFEEQNEILKEQASASKGLIEHAKQFNKTYVGLAIAIVVIIGLALYFANQRLEVAQSDIVSAQGMLTDTLQTTQSETVKALQVLRDELKETKNEILYWKQDNATLKAELEEARTQLKTIQGKS
jgi:hypothetical protein